VYYTNARSVRNKMNELRAVCHKEDFDIVAITESWVNVNTRDFIAEFAIPSYTILHKDRTDFRIGGGVLLLIKDSLNVIEKNCQANDHDIISIEIIDQNRKKIQFTLVYRPGTY